jgi:hypothetical protein
MIDSSGSFYPSFDMFFKMYGPTMLISLFVSLFLTLVLKILVYPVTYGLINKKYETGFASLSDTTGTMSRYIGRFVLYELLKIAIWAGALVVYFILLGIGFVITTAVSNVAGVILMILFTFAFIAGCIALGVYTSLWFSAVCVEDTDIITGLKNSFKYVSGSFWKILGISILISICGSVAGSIIGLIVGWVPIVGGTVSAVVGYLAEFITIVFYFEVYREKSGRFACPEYYKQINGGI